MICERCKKKKVSVIHRCVRSGRVQLQHLCTSCSEILEATGELEEISAALPPYTAPMMEEEGGCFPFFLTPNACHDSQGTCSGCGMSLEELLSEGRTGCAQCYTVFAGTIRKAVRAMHQNATHAGRLPTAARRRQEEARKLVSLREALREAIGVEDYERAVTLRDEIRVLEAGMACNT